MTPVASRDVGEYAWQAPGAAPPAPGSRLSGEGGTPANVAGARETSNNFLLDGVDNNDLYLNRVLVTPSIDAVQEFTLLTNTYDAQYGRSAGAQVNVVVEVGRRPAVRLDYAYFRDRALEARGPFDLAVGAGAVPPAPSGRRHGGRPARAAQGFYFVSLEGTRDRTRRHAPRARADGRGAGWRLQRSVPSADHRPVLRRTVSRQPDSRSRASTRPEPRWPPCTRCRTAPRRRATSCSSPVGPHDVWQVTGELRSPAPEGSDRCSCATASRATTATRLSGARANVPGFGTRTVDNTQNLAVGSRRDLRAAHVQRAALGWNRLAHDVSPDNTGVDGFARWA